MYICIYIYCKSIINKLIVLIKQFQFHYIVLLETSIDIGIKFHIKISCNRFA